MVKPLGQIIRGRTGRQLHAAGHAAHPSGVNRVARQDSAGRAARRLLLTGLVLVPALWPPPAARSDSARGRVEPPRSPGRPYVYKASLVTSEALQPYLREAERDSDLLPDERVAGALIARLSELSARLKQGAD